MPSFPPVDQILDTSYVKELAPAGGADDRRPTSRSSPPASKVERASSAAETWDIQFDTGKATFTAGAEGELKQLLNDLVVASGTLVEIHGHTDNAGQSPTQP